MNEAIDKDREAFEAYMLKQNPRVRSIHKYEDGEYRGLSIKEAYVIWQATSAAKEQEIAELREEIEDLKLEQIANRSRLNVGSA